MRLRALVALVIVLTIAPAVPALAENPTPPPASAQDPAPSLPPPPAATQEPIPSPPPSASNEESPAPKLEAGLAADGDGARVIVEVTTPAEAAPVAGKTEGLLDTQVVLQPPDTSFIVVEGTKESLAALAEDPRVVSIRRDRTYSPTSLASGLQVIGADKAHAAGIRGQGQMIAIIDTGIDAGHSDLGGKVLEQACFSATDDGVQSLCPNGGETDLGSADAGTAACLHNEVNLCDHGTHVAGIAHAVAPDADLVAIQVFSRVNDCDDEGGVCLTAYESSLLLALDHVAKLKDTRSNLAAVNLSLGGGLYEGSCDAEPELEAMRTRVETLHAKGVAVVAAAGNEGVIGAGAPGCFSSAVTVGATGDDDRVPEWSNHGSVLDLFAPGVEIDSAVPGGGHQVYSGTSMSTPHVTGAMALMAQKSPDTPDALLDRLKAAGRPIVYDGATTPRLDLNVAIVGGTPAPAVTQDPDPGDESDPDDPSDDPSPDPSAGPEPSPLPEEPADPTPVPLPTVTVTVTVTATPATVPTVCTRGKSKKTLTAAQWAVEVTRGKGELTDATLGCYLGMVGKASKVFSELTRVSTLGTAYRVLKPARKTGNAKLESELLAAWLNWAHGGVNFTAKIGETTTFKDILVTVEKQRLKAGSTSVLTSTLRKQVNARRTA